MNLKIYLKISIIIQILVRIFDNCQLGLETCTCIFTKNEIAMSCRQFSNESQVLNFASLKFQVENFNLTDLFISFKFFVEIAHEKSDFVRYIRNLNLNKNRIERIKENSFLYMDSLEWLDLHDNKILEIENNAFRGLSNLRSIFFFRWDKNFYNGIERIYEKTFYGLQKLETLDLNSNGIKLIEINSFSELKNLKILRLFFNKIDRITNGIFNNLSLVEELDLMQNRIIDIELHSFDGMEYLKKVNLHVNRIQKIRRYTFSNLKKIENLQLHQNEITEIESKSFDGMDNLGVITLYSNNLKFIESDLFTCLKNLWLLQMSHNEIYLPLSFNESKNVFWLYLDSNKIRKIEKATFIDLNFLNNCNLENNYIEEIETNSFQDLIRLAKLKLNKNKLQIIKKDIFNNLISLDSLDLSQNLLINIQTDSFLNMPQMTFLNLSHNYLSGEHGNIFRGLYNLKVLDLSFNSVNYLGKQFLNHLFSLEKLFLQKNNMKIIEPFAFGHLWNLKFLDLSSNSWQIFSKQNVFFNLSSLTNLNLNSINLKSLDLVRLNIEFLQNLKVIDLSNNFLDSVLANDFNFSSNWKSINLNLNSIQFIHDLAFEFSSLSSLCLSRTHLKQLNISFFKGRNLIELDLSLNKIELDLEKSEIMALTKNLQVIRLNCVKLISNNFSFEVFLNPSLKELDLSNNNLNGTFSILDLIVNVEVLKLQNVTLISIEQINLKNFKNVKYLDLSFNKILCLKYESFSNLNELLFLNLSNNQIFSIDEELNKMSLFSRLIITNMAHNKIVKFPHFGNLLDINEIYYENNSIKYLENSFNLFSSYVEVLYLDYNEINAISDDSFSFNKNLLILSLSNNKLQSVNNKIFYNLFSLKRLNLSHNLINFIESNSFQNLNKLLVLDLDFNHLKSIEAFQFVGLNSLNDLYLVSNMDLFTLNVESYKHLSNIGNFYLNESTIFSYKCIFMNSIERNIQRKIQRSERNYFAFFKSINLITPEGIALFKGNISEANLFNKTCETIFAFLQFNLHYNLKSDIENEVFFEKCKSVLIKHSSNFTNANAKCFPNYSVHDKEILEETRQEKVLSKIFQNYVFWLTMFIILLYLGLVFFLVLIHLISYDVTIVNSSTLTKKMVKKKKNRRFKKSKGIKIKRLKKINLK
jgi:Leucine-rich repeat (LRR) protein